MNTYQEKILMEINLAKRKDIGMPGICQRKRKMQQYN